MKETLSRVLHSSLEWDDADHQRAVDKLTAFSYSSSMATLLWRLKYGNDSAAHAPIVEILAKKLSQSTRRLSYDIAKKIAEQAVHEWLFAFCPVCLGAKEVMMGELRVVCCACDGVGVTRFSDQFRRLKMGGNYTRHIELLHNIISVSDLEPSEEMRRRLRRE